MFQYSLILLAVLAIFGMPSLESVDAAVPAMDYVVAFGVALLLKPWLESHLE